MIIYAENHGIFPDVDCTAALAALLKSLADVEEDKTLIFNKGTYHLSRENCRYIYRAITNTTAAEEYNNADEVNMHYVPFVFENIKNLTFDGGGSTFVIDGKVTNAVVTDCENLTLKNLRIKTVYPNMHKLTVLSKSADTAEFELYCESKYMKDGDNFCFYGNGYNLGFFDMKERAYWIGGILPQCKNNIFRTTHPFKSATAIEEIEPYRFKVYYSEEKSFEIGQTFYIFNCHRSDAGIFVEKSKNITLDNVEQNFNYSLAYVAQDCTDLTIKNCTFAPEKGSEIELASLADFMQICMCNGKIKIENNVFDSAADDALNVHGVHFKVTKINENKITVTYCHPQTWGFNPLHAGDKIEFINSQTLLSEGENRIISSEMTDSHHIELTLENAVDENFIHYVIEDTDRCPELVFENNTLNRIITRGILYTSRGKCVIKNNHFINVTASGVLISDDGKSWFESGMCRDVTIENNVFDYCGEAGVLINPENAVHSGAVHKNIKIKNNVFKKYGGHCINAKSAEDLEISGNTFCCGNEFVSTDCIGIKSDIQ